jgi:hypothetical protein
VLIGDNLGSHLSISVIEKCQELNIRFVLFLANSTHMCQPLNVAYFRPLKRAWRQVLTQWKLKNKGCLPKSVFPTKLRECLQKVESSSKQNILSGFRATGLCPLNRNEVLKHLPETVVEVHLTEENRALLNSFSEICQQTNIANSERVSVKRKKKFDVPAGQSVSVKDLADTTAQSKIPRRQVNVHNNNGSDNEEIAVESDEAEDIEDEDSLEAGPSGVSNLEEPPHEVAPDKDILHINSFVLVQFVYDKGSKKEKYKEFVAQIVDIDAPRNLYTVKCMRLYGEKKGMFVFPSIEDLCKITLLMQNQSDALILEFSVC